MANTKTPHKHAEVIKAWADGATIETKWGCGIWEEIERPSFSSDYEYRVKPETKKHKYRVALLSDGKDVWTTTEDCGDDDVGEFTYFVRYLTDWIEVEV
jgi:hypothetical protein